MFSGQKTSVQFQLTLAILLALFVSYLVSSATTYYVMRQEMHTYRRQFLAAHPEAVRHLPPEENRGLLNFLLGPSGPREHRHDDLSPNTPQDQPQPERPDPERMKPGEMPMPPMEELHGHGGMMFFPPPTSQSRLSLRGVALLRLGIALLLAIAIGATLSRRFTRPLKQLAQGARAFQGGEFAHRIPAAGTNEFAQVATAMNGMAERVAAQLGAMEEDNRRRQQLLADIAHELRGPVTTLRTMAGALDEGLAADTQRRERATRLMVLTTDRLQHLVTDLLELTRLDLHELPLHPQTVDVHELAGFVLQSHQTAAVEAGILLHEIAPGDPLLLTVDPNRFAQVLDNLLANAIAYAGQGAEVRLRLDEDATETRVTISDTGHGIPARHLPFIFDPFYRVDTARSPKDNHSGLGLRIARGLIEAQGGALRLESAEGQGTQAIISFPKSC